MFGLYSMKKFGKLGMVSLRYVCVLCCYVLFRFRLLWFVMCIGDRNLVVVNLVL